MRHITRLFALGAVLPVLFITGCAVTPVPITEIEVRSRVQADQFKIYSGQDPLFKPISFNEALARSFKYNLDYRLKLMESVLSQGLADVATYDMLPNLLVSAGYTSRNNLSGSRSFDIVDGKAVDRIPPSYSGGQDQQRRTASAEFSWNILDFGVGYYRAKQKANEVMIAEERRRRVVQNILSDVRSAYWRAVGAQRLARDADRLMERVRLALEKSREAEAQGLLSPKESLTYQRLLLDAVNLLSSRRIELDFAKRELSALMNVTPGTDFTVTEEVEAELMPVPINIAELEELALVNRPELRQEDYQVRITAAEARKQMLYLLPNLSLNVGGQYDSNKYLYKNDWADASARISFNLFRALGIADTKRAQEAQVQTDTTRRMALSMAILTQVRVAIERYRLALNELDLAKESNQVDQRMAAYTRAALTANAESELEVIRAETRALNSEFQRYAAYASAQAAFGRIYNSVGLEVMPPGLDVASLAEIGDKVAENIAQIENETFVRIVAVAERIPPLMVKFEGSETVALPVPASVAGMKMATGMASMAPSPASPIRLDAAAESAMLEAVAKALKRNRLDVSAGPGLHTLSMKLLADAPNNGVRRAQWLITMFSPLGKELGQTRYTSTLSADPAARSITAFAEASVIANLRNFSAWMNPETSN